MIVLEAPYASGVLLDWLEESGHPVLENEFATTLASGRPGLNLVGEDEARWRLADGERIYTCSENALDWVVSNASEELARAVTTCKDKATMRWALADIDGVFFREFTLEGLESVDPEGFQYPLVVKPTVGFISFGVHVVTSPEAWGPTLATLRREIEEGSVFPASVIGDKAFIVEGFITGQEYAIDLYFDGDGEPVILDIMQHDFLDEEDTSDHFYFTSVDLMNRAEPRLRAWFKAANERLGFRAFCTHVELRVSHRPGEDPIDAMRDMDNIHVIEFNPLRFAGFCATDLGYYAYGIRTYEWYLSDKRPDWEKVLDGIVGATAFSVVDKPSNWRDGATFDVERLEHDLAACGEGVEIYEMRPMDIGAQGISCFPMYHVATTEGHEATRRFALTLNPDEYVSLRG